MRPRVVLVCPIIRPDYVYKAVETLYKYTDNFSLIIVDQTIDGLKEPIKCDLLIRCRNQGFAKAANEGMIHGLRWGADYIGVMNDDVEMIYKGWLPDALLEFETDPRILAVNPESPTVPLWGYGRPMGENLDLIEHKEQFTPEDIGFLKSGDYLEELQKRYEIEPVDLPLRQDGKKDWNGKIYIPINRQGNNRPHAAFEHKRGVIDGFAGWLPIFKRQSLIEIGFFDERFVWGGGEDYHMMMRAYSCAWPIDRTDCDERYHRRMVSTMKSWVWHFWGASKDKKDELDPRLFEAREPWNDLDYLVPPELNDGNHGDPWGHWTDKNGIKRPFRFRPDIYIHPL